MHSASRLSRVFTVMAVLLTLSIASMYTMGLFALRRAETVRRHLEINERLQVTYSNLKDAETGQRGYLLTGEEAYLEPYHSGVESAHRHIARLQETAAEGELAPDDLNALKTLVDEKLAESKLTIDLRRAKGFDAALAVVKSDEGKRRMDDIRRLIDRLVETEHTRLVTAQDSARQLTRLRTATFIVCGLMNLVFIGWAYRRIRSEMAGREAAAAEIRRQKDLLSVTLGSIGDAVIVTDRDSHITFMNPMAERLTGWPAREAVGKPCVEVFRIINESSREPVESPVDKVLRIGGVVGLANHTLLVSRDGSEIPIDDSGAPIRDDHGTIHGVVLVFRDFTEHKQAERKLKTANAELAAASLAKDQFLAALSHELRTPLTPVLATLTAWEMDLAADLPAELRSDVKMLRRNVELEARLIDDLLDLTRIVKGKLSLNLERVDVHDLVQSVTEMFGNEIRDKGIRLSIHPEAPRPHINADPARIQQIFWNVLKNAAKFTPRGGTINVTTANADGQLLVTFSDTGIGMASSTLERLFRPFEQGNDKTVRQFGGLGMGLAISKALVEAHGGAIAAASDGEGQGSTFTIRLTANHETAGPAAETTQLTDASTPPLATNSPADATADGKDKKLRIALIEDHADTIAVLTRLLRRWGHHVSTAESVTSARALLTDNSFDLIVSDVGLPDGTGIELIQWLRQRSSVPAIALTGFGMEDDLDRCREAGFNAHLTKPVNFQTLQELIEQVVPPTAG